MTLIDRFLKYVSFDTQSDPGSATFPSTPGQLVLLRYLADEMRALGVADVVMDAHGYVTGTIPATEGCENEPVIGFLAHVDTSPDAPGANVRPVIEGDIIRTDGTTLLGADDKAGVAEIMTAAEYLLSEVADPHSDPPSAFLPHGRIRIAFTPDEEIGRGVDFFDVAAFGADFAYTMDGGAEGELEYENFNAAGAKITIRGRGIHPGVAKGKMVNALHVAMEIDAALPARERPEHTEGYEGFYHLTRLDGTVEESRMEYIIRDFDREKFEKRKQRLAEIVARFEGAALELKDQYYNMREVIERRPEIIERAEMAMRAAGVIPIVKPVRGGTDGARLSFMGLPCPNIFAGGVNFHSRDEYVSISAMQKAVEVIVGIARVKPPGRKE